MARAQGWSQPWLGGPAALQRLQSGGVQIREFPDSVWDAFGTAAEEVTQEPMGDEMYARFYESYMASLRSSAEWISRSEDEFTRQRNRVVRKRSKGR